MLSFPTMYHGGDLGLNCVSSSEMSIGVGRFRMLGGQGLEFWGGGGQGGAKFPAGT